MPYLLRAAEAAPGVGVAKVWAPSVADEEYAAVPVLLVLPETSYGEAVLYATFSVSDTEHCAAASVSEAGDAADSG